MSDGVVRRRCRTNIRLLPFPDTEPLEDDDMIGRTFISRAALAGAAFVLAPALAAAQDDAAQDDAAPLSDAELIGDPAAGRAIALDTCAECHGVAPNVFTSPDEDATPFATLAETPGMTSRALTVWLTTFHPGRTMPMVLLERDEREDVIAYILSLRED